MSSMDKLQEVFSNYECQNRNCSKNTNEAEIIMKISPTALKGLGEKAQAWTEDKQQKTEQLVKKVVIPSLSLYSGANEEITVEKTKSFLEKLSEHFDLSDSIKVAEINRIVDKYQPEAEPLSRTEKQVYNQVDRVMLAINIHSPQFFSSETVTLCKKCYRKIEQKGHSVEDITISPFRIEVGREQETTKLVYKPDKTPKVGENYTRKALISAIEKDKKTFPEIAKKWYQNQ